MKARITASGQSIWESMENVFDVESWPALMAFLREKFYFWQPTEDNVTIQFYATDERIGWKVHIVCIDGKAALFTDGILPDMPVANILPGGEEPIY